MLANICMHVLLWMKGDVHVLHIHWVHLNIMFKFSCPVILTEWLLSFIHEKETPFPSIVWWGMYVVYWYSCTQCTQFCWILLQICWIFFLQITSTDYTVKSSKVSSDGTPSVYSVSTLLGRCTCYKGKTGAPCKHQAGVTKFFGASSFNFVPVNDENTRCLLYKIATGMYYLFQNINTYSKFPHKYKL